MFFYVFRRFQKGARVNSISPPLCKILLCLQLLFFSNPIFSHNTKQISKEEKFIIHALKTDTTPNIDGILDEALWQAVSPATNFIQKQPDEGHPATENTEVRVLYDRHYLYIGLMCYDKEPSKIIANEKRRDSESILENDHVMILLDTYHDRRNGYIFATNPLAARLDYQIRREGIQEDARPFMANPNINRDWNCVWDVKSAILPNGWSAEITIPLYSLRYKEHPREGWGFNIFRNIRRKNEESTWAPLPRNLEFHKISMAGTFKGLEALEKGLKLQLKPFAISNRVYEKDEQGTLVSETNIDGGIDIKYGLTSNITADMTVNTDFSQVEADDQQINLTRFSLYYPEKREFFLENAAIFSVGAPEDAMIFFSRRIGLSEKGDEIPLLGGIKVAGKAGRFDLGIINLQTKAKGDIPSNNFTVARISRDILKQSAIGMMVTNRQSSESENYNRAISLDCDFAFGESLSLGGYLALTQTPGLGGKNTASKFRFQWTSDFWNIYGHLFNIQENFNADMGFVKRTGIRRSQMYFGYTPEPALPGVKRLNPHVNFTYTTDQENVLLLREEHVHFQVDLINGGNFGFSWNENHEFVDVPFTIQENITIPVGIYTDRFLRADLSTDKSRNLYIQTRYRWGAFYGGKSKELDISGGFRPIPNLSGEISLLYNDIDLPQGDFVNHLLISKLAYSFSTRFFLMSLIQWNGETDDVSLNMRLHYIYRPGSDLYIVYNERRLVEGMDIGIQDRTIAIKLNYLFNM